MNTLVHADIFFFITTIAVIVFFLFICVALYYVIRILMNFNTISKILKNGAMNIEEGVSDAVRELSENPFVRMFFGHKRKQTKRNHKGK